MHYTDVNALHMAAMAGHAKCVKPLGHDNDNRPGLWYSAKLRSVFQTDETTKPVLRNHLGHQARFWGSKSVTQSQTHKINLIALRALSRPTNRNPLNAKF